MPETMTQFSEHIEIVINFLKSITNELMSNIMNLKLEKV